MSSWPTLPESLIFFAVLREIEIADGAEAMIDGDEDDVVVAREIFAVVGGMLLAASGDVTAAVEPNHDGAFGVVVDGRRPHVEVEAVFVLDAVGPVEHPGVFVFGPAGARGLRRDVAVLHGAAQAGPWLGLGGRHETRGAFGAGAEGDAFEGVDAVAGVAADFAGGGFDDVGFVGGDDGGGLWWAGVGGAAGGAAFAFAFRSGRRFAAAVPARIVADWIRVRRVSLVT